MEGERDNDDQRFKTDRERSVDTLISVGFALQVIDQILPTDPDIFYYYSLDQHLEAFLVENPLDEISFDVTKLLGEGHSSCTCTLTLQNQVYHHFKDTVIDPNEMHSTASSSSPMMSEPAPAQGKVRLYHGTSRSAALDLTSRGPRACCGWCDWWMNTPGRCKFRSFKLYDSLEHAKVFARRRSKTNPVVLVYEWDRPSKPETSNVEFFSIEPVEDCCLGGNVWHFVNPSVPRKSSGDVDQLTTLSEDMSTRKSLQLVGVLEDGI